MTEPRLRVVVSVLVGAIAAPGRQRELLGVSRSRAGALLQQERAARNGSQP